MVNCFFCDAKLENKGPNKIVVPLDEGKFAIVDVNSSLQCHQCKESFVNDLELLEGFMKIKNFLGTEKTISSGIYN